MLGIGAISGLMLKYSRWLKRCERMEFAFV
jgi:hypothetical protein